MIGDIITLIILVYTIAVAVAAFGIGLALLHNLLESLAIWFDRIRQRNRGGGA